MTVGHFWSLCDLSLWLLTSKSNKFIFVSNCTEPVKMWNSHNSAVHKILCLQSDFWPYLVSSWPWLLTCWRQTLISLSLPQLHLRCKFSDILTSDFFTALHCMQRGMGNRKAVCPSVCPSNACIVTKRKHLAKKVPLVLATLW